MFNERNIKKRFRREADVFLQTKKADMLAFYQSTMELEKQETQHRRPIHMRRRIAVCACLLILAGAIGISSTVLNTSPKYKRIHFSNEMLGPEDVLQGAVGWHTKVENLANETYSDTMSVYQITPRTVSIDEFEQFAAYLRLTQPINYDLGYPRITDDLDGSKQEWYVLALKENGVSYQEYRFSKKMTQTDEELEALAKEIFSGLPLIMGEYEYLGEASTQSVTHMDETYVVKRRFSFRRLLDDVRVIGDDICDIYFDAQGLCGIELRLFNYEKVNEIDMLSLKDAVKHVKNPDAFSLNSNLEQDSTFKGVADTLTIEHTKLLFVNQYSDGCEILQPVYNLMGILKNESGRIGFSASVIAIPKKYTYE